MFSQIFQSKNTVSTYAASTVAPPSPYGQPLAYQPHSSAMQDLTYLTYSSANQQQSQSYQEPNEMEQAPLYMYRQQHHQHAHQHQNYPQQNQQFVYENPSNRHADIYNAPSPPYIQDNSLYDQQQPQQYRMQYYISAALIEQIMAQLLQQAGLHSTADSQLMFKVYIDF